MRLIRNHLPVAARTLVALALAMLVLGVSAAQLRSIPPQAKRAEMQPPQNGVVHIGDRNYHMSASLQIRDKSNRIVVPVAVTEPHEVRFLLDQRGDVIRVWILTDDERAQPDPK